MSIAMPSKWEKVALFSTNKFMEQYSGSNALAFPFVRDFDVISVSLLEDVRDVVTRKTGAHNVHKHACMGTSD